MTRLNNNTIRVSFTSEANMEAIKNFIVGNRRIDDDIVLEHLSNFACGFILTNAVITLVAQINCQFKYLDKKSLDIQVQQLDSVKHYYKVITKDKSCIFFRNCLAVIESIIITITDYTGLDSDQRRKLFLTEVEALNSSGVPARLLANPNKDNIIMHRKAIALRIRSGCQADPIYKMESLLSGSKSIWDKVTPDRFITSFGLYTNCDPTIIINEILIQEDIKNINLLIASKLFNNFNSSEVKFSESIGVNVVPFETLIIQSYEKHIVRIKENYVPIVPTGFTDPNDPLGVLLNIQKQKYQKPGGLKSDKRRK